MVKYFLMHKNDICGTLIFDELTGHILNYKSSGNGLSPCLGQADLPKIQKWWEMRAVPASRTMIQDVIRKTGCINTETYLVKNLGLSITDAYWICPADMSIKYDQIKFQNFKIYNNGKIPYHNESSYDFNASLGGQMDKYWNLDGQIPCLVKESIKYYGQQSMNEVIATKIHELQQTNIPYVRYKAEAINGHGIVSYCDAFTSENVEFIPAYEVIESQKPENSSSLYNHYIDLCVQKGICQELIQDYMDYQTMTDFIISNTDEHLLNFGVLRDTNTMKLIGPAPIFDSGNSMFYKEERILPYSKVELLSYPINSFYKSEEKMLANVHNRNIVKFDLLPDPAEIKSLYEQFGLPGKKADFISKNYEKKLELVHEFQLGKTISLYHEKIKERNFNHSAYSTAEPDINAESLLVAEKLYLKVNKKGIFSGYAFDGKNGNNTLILDVKGHPSEQVFIDLGTMETQIYVSNISISYFKAVMEHPTLAEAYTNVLNVQKEIGTEHCDEKDLDVPEH